MHALMDAGAESGLLMPPQSLLQGGKERCKFWLRLAVGGWRVPDGGWKETNMAWQQRSVVSPCKGVMHQVHRTSRCFTQGYGAW